MNFASVYVLPILHGVDLPFAEAETWQGFLDRLVPHDAAKGEEGVSLQGAVLIGLLAAIGFASWRGLEHIQSGVSGRYGASTNHRISALRKRLRACCAESA